MDWPQIIWPVSRKGETNYEKPKRDIKKVRN